MRYFATKVNRNAMLELTEDSPYKFNNHKLTLKMEELKPVHENQKEFFRSAYEHMLQYMCEGNHEVLQQMLEPKLYSEVSEYLKENIALNDVEMKIENKDTSLFEIYVAKQYFMCGYHIDRSRNEKEYVSPYKPNFDYKGDLEVYQTKVPLKYTSMPLNLVFELVYKTNMKLNLHRQNMNLIDIKNLETPEYHLIRYEGKIADFGNHVEGILRMKRKYLKFKEQVKNGQLDEVQEWTITNIDNCMETFKKI